MDTPAIAFGILALLLGIMLHKKRTKITKVGGKESGRHGLSGGRKFGLPPAVLNRIISVLMFLGGTGLAATFIGDWLAQLDFSVAGVTSTAVIVIVAVLLGFAVLIDVLDGNGLKPTTYVMVAMFPLMWAAAGGSLAWPRAISSTAWSWLNGQI